MNKAIDGMNSKNSLNADKIQSCIDHIKSAIDVDEWAKDIAENVLLFYKQYVVQDLPSDFDKSIIALSEEKKKYRKTALKAIAEKLNGRQYLDELHSDEEEELKQQGIVVVYGYSDDCVEFRGAIDDEVGMFCDGAIWVPPEKDTKSAIIVSHSPLLWEFKTEIPHEEFIIYEDAEVFGKGIVFFLEDC